MDRNLGVTFGASAVYALSKGMNGVMGAVKPTRLEFVPLQEATAKLKLVTPENEFVLAARILDVSFGDQSAGLQGHQK